MKPTLTHLALHVRDLNACVDFYQAFCEMHVIHQRLEGHQHVIWMAEQGREKEFIFVLMSGGKSLLPADDDYSHLGFALGSKQAVDALAAKAKQAGCLVWEPKQEPFPVGYYCGLKDPDGRFVEFSYGQPLGPGVDE